MEPRDYAAIASAAASVIALSLGASQLSRSRRLASKSKAFFDVAGSLPDGLRKRLLTARAHELAKRLAADTLYSRLDRINLVVIALFLPAIGALGITAYALNTFSTGIVIGFSIQLIGGSINILIYVVSLQQRKRIVAQNRLRFTYENPRHVAGQPKRRGR